jgi:hypothetical protein
MESKGPVEFRRRIPPTPQATRLMKISLASGLLFILVLSAVFVPRALQYDQPPNPIAVLALRSAGPFVVEVVRVNVEKPLAEYRAELSVTGYGRPSLNATQNPLAEGDWPAPFAGNVSFDDADGDGALSAGDTFTVLPRSGYSSYLLLVFHESAFVDPRPPCPCAAARIEFPA